MKNDVNDILNGYKVVVDIDNYDLGVKAIYTLQQLTHYIQNKGVTYIDPIILLILGIDNNTGKKKE